MSDIYSQEYMFSDEVKEAYNQYIKQQETNKEIKLDRMNLDQLPHMRQTELLKQGYEQMAKINLEFAESGLNCDICSLESYENSLKMERSKNGY